MPGEKWLESVENIMFITDVYYMDLC
jgi:hypothetical protein